MARLTRKEKEAILTVLDEFLAGHDVEMTRSAFGYETEGEAKALLYRLQSASAKLASGLPA